MAPLVLRSLGKEEGQRPRHRARFTGLCFPPAPGPVVGQWGQRREPVTAMQARMKAGVARGQGASPLGAACPPPTPCSSPSFPNGACQLWHRYERNLSLHFSARPPLSCYSQQDRVWAGQEPRRQNREVRLVRPD